MGNGLNRILKTIYPNWVSRHSYIAQPWKLSFGMKDFEPVVRYFGKYIHLTDEEKDFLRSLLRKVAIRKKQFIVQPGFTCKYRTYVLEGAFRSYLYDKNGNEHTVALAVEDWWISDFDSYIHQKPATLFVEALEKSVVIQMDYEDEVRLLETYPKFERFFRILYQKTIAALQCRTLNEHSMTAEERYHDFVERYPQVAFRVPQYALASYLGFSTEYLSKIRNKRVKPRK